MANYNGGIIMALTALNKQRDIVSKARDDHKQLVGKALENGNETGYGFDSALAAMEDRRKTLTAIIGLEDLAATTLNIKEALKPLVLPSFGNKEGTDDPDATNETGGQANNDDDDWITIASDEDDIDAPANDAPTPTSASPDVPQPAVKRPTTTRKRRPTRSKGNDGITFSDYGGVDTLIQSPTIVKLKDGSFVELRCDICGGNTSWAHNTVISGIRGFQAHYRLMHQTTVKVDKVLQRCKHRDVPDEEAQRIINGEHQVELIHCESKVNLKSDTVYVGQSAVASGNVPKRGARTVEEVAAARAKADSESKNSKRKRANKAIDSAVDSADDSDPTPKPKKSLKRDRSAPHLSNCPIIVQIPSNNDSSNPTNEATFIELRCDTCHGNGSFSSGKLLYGIKGFKAHYREIHKEHLGTAEILTRCRFREVEAEEVRAIQAGVKGVGFVRCQGSPNVRPKKSYRDFVVEAV